MFYIVTVTGLIFFVNLIFFHLNKSLNLCCQIASIGVIIFCWVLVYQGGIENTALYWVLSLPLVLFALLGYRHGAIANGVVFISLIIMLNNLELLVANYSHPEIMRFISSLFVINIISFINEYFREHSHSAMTDINISKEQQANTDVLTQLPNRRFIDSVFFPATKANVSSRFPMVLVMADVDNFKSFNDNYGHHTGDKILEKLAHTMKECSRSDDIVARIGGEEFLLVFSNTHYDIALIAAEKIRRAISVMKLEHEGQKLEITMSFGVAIAHDYSEIDNRLQEADKKLYQAKRAGRNCIC